MRKVFRVLFICVVYNLIKYLLNTEDYSPTVYVLSGLLISLLIDFVISPRSSKKTNK